MKRIVAVFFLALLLVSCAPTNIVPLTPTQTNTSQSIQLMLTPTPISVPVANPTAILSITATFFATISPTPIPLIQVGNLSVPDLHFSNPELFNIKNKNAPVLQFIKALKFAGIEIDPQEISNKLHSVFIFKRKEW
jgi:hypothetical protein